MRWILILGGLAVLALSILVLWVAIPWGGARNYPAELLAEALTTATGEPVTIGQVSQIDWSNGLDLHLKDLAIGPIDRPVLHLDRLEARIDLIDAVSGGAALRLLQVGTATFRPDESSPNWPLNRERADSLESLVRTVDRLGIERLDIERRGQPTVRLDRVTASRGALDSLEIDGSLAIPLQGNAGDAPAADGVLEGVLRGVTGLFDGSGATVQLRVQAGATLVTARGSAIRLDVADGVDLAIGVDTGGASALATLLGHSPDPLASVRRSRLRTQMRTTLMGVALDRVDLRLETTSGTVSASGRIGDLRSLTGADLRLGVSGSNLAPFGSLIGFALPPTDGYQASAHLTQTGDRTARLADVSARMTFGPVRAQLTGGIADMTAGTGFDLTVEMQTGDLGSLGPLVGMSLPTTGSVEARGHLLDKPSPEPWRPRLESLVGRITVPDGTISMEGSVDDPEALSGLDLSLHAVGGSLHRLSDVAGRPLPRTDRFDLAATLEGNAGSLQFPSVQGTIALGSATVIAAGTWLDPGSPSGFDLDSLDLALSVAGDDLATLSDLAGRPLPRTDRFDGAGRLTISDGQVRLTDLAGEAVRQDAVIAASGRIDDPFGTPAPTLELSLTGSDPQSVAADLFGRRIPYLPDMTRIEASGRMTSDPASGRIGLEAVRVRTSRPGLTITGEGHVEDLLAIGNPDVAITAEGDDLFDALDLDREKVGGRLPPAGPFRLTGRVANPRADDGPGRAVLTAVQGTIELPDAQLAVVGEGGALPDFAGLDLSLTLSGTSLALVGDAGPLTAMTSVSGSGSLRMTEAGLRLTDIDVAAEGPLATLNLTGQIGGLPEFEGMALEGRMSGSDLFAFLAPDASLRPKTDRFEGSGRVTAQADGLAVDAMSVSANRADTVLTFSGSLADLVAVSGLSGDVALAGPDLAMLASDLGVALPPTGEAELTGRLSGGSDGLALGDITGTVTVDGGSVAVVGSVGDLLSAEAVQIDLDARGTNIADARLPVPPEVAAVSTDRYRAAMTISRVDGTWTLPTLDASATSGHLTVSVQGAVADLAGLRGMAIDISAAADQSREITSAFGPTLARLGPLSLEGRVSGTGTTPVLEIRSMRLGASDITGSVSADDMTARPLSIRADLRSDLVDVTSLLRGRPAVAADPNDEGAPPTKPGTSGLLSDWPVPEGLSIDLSWTVQAFAAYDMILDQLTMSGRLGPDRIAIEDMRARHDGTPVAASVSIARPTEADDAPSLDARVTAQAIDLGALLARSRIADDIAAVADMTLALRTAADTHGPLAGRLSGKLAAVITDGEIPRRLAELMAGDLPALVAAWFAGRDTAPIRCGVVHVTLDQGLGILDRLAIETEGLVIVGDGLIDLANDRLDIQLKPRARESRLLHAEADVSVTGSIDAPEVQIDPAAVAADVLTFVPAFLLDGAGRLVSLVEGGADQPNRCTLNRRLDQAG